MGHDQNDTLKSYWSTTEQFNTPFYRNTMKRDRFFYIMRYLTTKTNLVKRENDNRLWKMRTIFISSASKYYNPTEQLAVHEFTVLFKDKVIFERYIPKKHKRFGIKVYKRCDCNGYKYDMRMHLGKYRQCETGTVTVAHAAVTGIANIRHKL